MMIKSKIIYIVVFALILFLPGCSYVIEITYDNNDPYTPTFSFTEKHLIFDRKPRVREITMYKIVENQVDYSSPVWSIESDGIRIDQMTYGIPPNGFKVITQAKKLTPSTQYHVVVRAWGSGGFIEFKTPEST